MIAFLTTIAIIGVLVLAFIGGRQRGFFAVAGSFLSLLLSLTVAGLAYHALGRLLVSILHLTSSVANLLAYALLVVFVQFGLLMLVHRLVLKLPRQAVLSPVNMFGGAVVAMLEAAVFMAIGLALVNSLPIESSVTKQITGAALARPLVMLGDGLQRVVVGAPGQDLIDTFNLLTVDPESERVVTLGFTTTDVTDQPQLEDRMLQLINDERTSRGLAPLRMSEKARQVGRSYSVRIFAEGRFSHRGSDGSSPFDRMEAGGLKFRAAGENLALAPTLSQAHIGLMNSPGHRANILSKNYHSVGIGIVRSPTYGLMVTQDFTD
jgi:uncharacterized protein YkwD